MSLKTLFLLLGTIAIFSAAQQAEPVVCNNPNPSPDNICTLEFRPVCAYYFVCLGGASCEGVTIGNACQACDQDGYDYYFDGPCGGDGNGGEEEGSSEETGEGETEGGDGIVWCSSLPFIPEVCTLEYAPVCAYSNTEEGTTEGVTVGNGCIACRDGYDYYTDGACTDNGEGGEEEGPTEEYTEGGSPIIWCPNPDLSATDIVCTLEYDPVCAYRATGDSNVGTTVGNACQACLQQGFDYYTKGACEDDGNGGEEEGPTEETGNGENEEGGAEEGTSGIIWCTPSEFPPTEEVACTDIFDPVCAYRVVEGEVAIGVTVGNVCQACLLEGFDYYTPGACEDNTEGGAEEEVVIIIDPNAPLSL